MMYADTQELLARIESLDGDELRALRVLRGALETSTAVGNRPSLSGHLWYLAEILAAGRHEPETIAILQGIITRSPVIPPMFDLGGREREIHDEAIQYARDTIGDTRFEASPSKAAT
jgi:hypothetical protein